MKTSNNNYGFLYFFLISLLSLIFVSLIYFSTSSDSLEVDYSFKDNVSILLDEYGNPILDVKIGEIKLKNNGFLSKRVSLDSYYLCNFDSNMNFINLDYQRGSDFDYDYFMNSNSDFVDLSSGSSDNLEIIIKSYLVPYDISYAYGEFGDKVNLSSVDYFLFKLPENTRKNYYDNYCDDFNIEDSIMKITINLKNE